jgi:hypothetical protein
MQSDIAVPSNSYTPMTPAASYIDAAGRFAEAIAWTI